MWISFKPQLRPLWIIAFVLCLLGAFSLTAKKTLGEGVSGFFTSFVVLFGIVGVIIFFAVRGVYKTKINLETRQVKVGKKVFLLSEIPNVGVFVHTAGASPSVDLALELPNGKVARIPLTLPFWRALSEKQFNVVEQLPDYFVLLPETTPKNVEELPVEEQKLSRQELKEFFAGLREKSYSPKI